MKKIVLASKNIDKLKEMRLVLGSLPLEILSLADFSDMPDAVEDGLTFEDNALIKARFFRKITGLACLADDPRENQSLPRHSVLGSAEDRLLGFANSGDPRDGLRLLHEHLGHHAIPLHLPRRRLPISLFYGFALPCGQPLYSDG